MSVMLARIEDAITPKSRNLDTGALAKPEDSIVFECECGLGGRRDRGCRGFETGSDLFALCRSY